MPESTSPQEVHILFHLVGDITYPAQKKHLEDQLSEVFTDSVSIVHEDPPLQQDREVIYGLKPGARTNEEFFAALDAIFLATARNLPSFTQVTEVA